MKELTKAEEQIMQVIWDTNGAFVKDIIEQLPSPKPAYNTVSTIVRILEQKQFVKHESVGRSHKYLPAVDKETYASFSAQKVLKGYFGNSVEQLLSFFVKDKNLSLSELDEMLKAIKNQNE